MTFLKGLSYYSGQFPKIFVSSEGVVLCHVTLYKLVENQKALVSGAIHSHVIRFEKITSFGDKPLI